MRIARAPADGLRRRGVDVTTTPDAGLRMASDEAQIAFVQAERRVFFTQDDDFLGIHASGTPHHGIVYCKKDSRGIGEMVRGLALIWEVYEPEELEGRIEFL